MLSKVLNEVKTDLIQLTENRKSEMSVNVYEYLQQIIQSIEMNNK